MGEVVISHCKYCLTELLVSLDVAAAKEFPGIARPWHKGFNSERHREYVAFRENYLNRRKRRCYRFESELGDVEVCADCLRKVITELE